MVWPHSTGWQDLGNREDKDPVTVGDKLVSEQDDYRDLDPGPTRSQGD